MRADDDIDAPILEAFFDPLELGGRHEPRSLPHAYRKSSKALRERLEVLAGQKRGRNDNGHLPPTHCNNESGAQCHLRLAEPHVAANQTVHDPARCQVVKNRVDRLQLILGLLIWKPGAELVIGTGLDFNRLGRCRLTRGSDPDELFRHVADALLEPRLLGLPGNSTQAVKLRAVI